MKDILTDLRLQWYENGPVWELFKEIGYEVIVLEETQSESVEEDDRSR